jgi:serine phosphatase RsbU (regulator of sigma subunit)
MTEEADPRNPMLPALEGLAAVETAGSVEDVLRATVETACVATASRRGLAGLSDGEAVTAVEWFDAVHGWVGTPLRWEIGEGGPGRVCESGTPLACNDLPGTAECVPEATAVLRLTRFACVPFESAAGGPVGFLEVGNRETDYTADEIRCLSIVARRATQRLQTLARRDEQEAEERLCSEALLGGRELFSLDPEVVLAEAAARAGELTGAEDVVALRLDGTARSAEGLDDDERESLEEAVTTRAPAHARARVLTVPLFGDDRLLGALIVRDAPVPLADERREALVALAARARVALEHAVLYQTQAAIAFRLQERLLPLDPPKVPGLDVAVAYRSASHGAGRGGDFIDFYSRTDAHLALVIGDVAGKGVDALATTLVVKYVLRAAVSGGALSWPARPGAALQEIHNAMLGELGGESFVTALFALVGVRRGMLQLATAGHPAPFVVRATGVERSLLLTAPAIGIDLEAALAPYPSEVLTLDRGDCVVFFTDGIAELRDARGAFFEDAMPGALAEAHDRPAAETVARLLERAGEFAAQPPADDIAVVCLRLTRRPDVKGLLQETDTVGKEYGDAGGTGES